MDLGFATGFIIRAGSENICKTGAGCRAREDAKGGGRSLTFTGVIPGFVFSILFAKNAPSLRDSGSVMAGTLTPR